MLNVRNTEENMSTPKSLEAAQRSVSRLWNKMCEEEGVPVDSKFVVFTSTNKFSVRYNKAVQAFFLLKRTIELGGR
jgi:hypothetical protein